MLDDPAFRPLPDPLPPEAPLPMPLQVIEPRSRRHGWLGRLLRRRG